MFNDIEQVYKYKKVLVTGHSGFKGKWLCRILKKLNCEVFGFSSYKIESSLFGFDDKSQLVDKEYIGDICTYDLNNLIKKISPDYIFHFAAQALVKESIREPINTFKTNTLGTCLILDALKNLKKRINVVLITSDKVYKNKEWIWGYRETDQLGGKDPYSASKAMAEIGIQSYLNTYDYLNNGINIAIGRAGNVIGGGDWSRDRLIPDLIKSIKSKNIIMIRSPKATRPWQHVLDPLYGYLKLGASLDNDHSLHGEAFNFGPSNQEARSVESICYQVKDIFPEVKFKINDIENCESNLLQLDCAKSLIRLGFSARFDSYQAVEMTINWYRQYMNDKTKLKYIIDEQIRS
tara:strand:+ start:47636 stop:48682 length:1047 start_codon:yes stop_codon:yes gene_type:complete